MSAGSAGELNWLLDNLVNRVAQVHQAVVLSSDGLLVGASTGLTRENAEHLSAVAASFQSLARSAGRQFGGGAVRQTIVEMDHAFLFVTAAGSNADVGMIAYEMAMLVKRVGQHMSTLPRSAVES
jgi:predicted regulator of Ras-like GTPase activity (Roadblock/LC7/MglB family)